jgi:hypothetical protein
MRAEAPAVTIVPLTRILVSTTTRSVPGRPNFSHRLSHIDHDLLFGVLFVCRPDFRQGLTKAPIYRLIQVSIQSAPKLDLLLIWQPTHPGKHLVHG